MLSIDKIIKIYFYHAKARNELQQTQSEKKHCKNQNKKKKKKRF